MRATFTVAVIELISKGKYLMAQTLHFPAALTIAAFAHS
jgi:hypothetical protein